MKTLYLDLQNGIAGDMLCAALLDLFADPQAVLQELRSLGLPVTLELEDRFRCGVKGKGFVVRINGVEESEHLHEHGHHACCAHHGHHHEHGHVHEHEHEHHHSHSSMEDISTRIEALPLSDQVKADSLAVYRLIAEAESHIHGVPVEQIHFHEVGELDAVADIVCACWLMEKLGIQRVLASPVNTGSGTVHCAHGLLPVPAPATLHILKGIPLYAARAQSELCTPTGAALARHFVDEYCPLPLSITERTGYGMGNKEFSFANCLRALLLQEAEQETDSVIELACNLDDMSGEQIAYACEQLLAQGALDVYTSPLQMKKGRPGTLLSLLCKSADRARMVELLFLHTSSIGLREYALTRHTLSRHTEDTPNPFGLPLRRKVSQGYGVQRSKYEHADLARIAEEKGLSIEQVLAQLD